MRIIVHGNPVDGFSFIGPFADSVNIPERHTEPLDEWWFASLDEPNRKIARSELTAGEQYHLESEDLRPDDGIYLWRDDRGIAWAYSEATATTYDLTNGLIPTPPFSPRPPRP